MKKMVLLLVIGIATLIGVRFVKETSLNYVPVEMVTRTVDYTQHIEPILNKRCVVCHSCYNSPCQLKLSSFEGLDRGATKEEVYNSKRLMTMDPTRLFVDAQSTEEWRQKDFTSVTQSREISGGNDSFLLRFISHKKDSNPQSALTLEEPDYKKFLTASENAFSPEEEELQCAATYVEVDEYLKKHPNRGMPYGFPPLTTEEFELIRDWLVLGAHGPSPEETQKDSYIIPEDRKVVEEWEKFLNGEIYPGNPQRDLKRMMTARYLFEHLFLAHISFDKNGKRFYELVRSKSPPGVPVKVIGTIRPYDDPETDRVYYRFRRVTSTIVHKTHMVFELNEKVKERIEELFLKQEWLDEPVILADYYSSDELNPFVVFQQIPPKSRYSFLLDNIHYVIMTFIRGPVCKGQVALNVIRDQFWMVFVDPEHDLTVINPDFLVENKDLLNIPTDRTFWFKMLRQWYFPSHEAYVEKYVEARRTLYENVYRDKGINVNSIWTGRMEGETPESDSPVLTVFRHFNSASVHQGVLGGLPQTAWVLDYPLAERIYYALVAGFNVFGNRGHQLATRLYMDGLRQEAETYFLDYLPLNDRQKIMQKWYGSVDIGTIRYRPMQIESGVQYSKGQPKRELLESIVNRIPDQFEVEFDHNYLKGDQYPDFPESFTTEEDYIQGFLSVSEPGSRFFKQVKMHGANIAFIRVKVAAEKDVIVSMVINRWHDNVRTMVHEEENLDPRNDEADFIEGYVGSYPNYFFVVDVAELGGFLRMLRDFDYKNPCHMSQLLEYGVNRERADFWEVYDWFQEDFNKKFPHTGGIFDLNRYYKMAIGAQGKKYYQGKCEGEEDKKI